MGLRKKRVPKKVTQRKHLVRRMKERFGIDLNDKLMCELQGIVCCGKAKFLEKESNRLQHYLVSDFHGKTFEVVWDDKRNQVVTAFNHRRT